MEGAVWPKTWSDFSILVKVVCNWHHISVLGDLGRSSVIISVPRWNLIVLLLCLSVSRLAAAGAFARLFVDG